MRMRNFLALCLLAVSALTAAAKDIKEYVVTTTPQMSCQNCENRIKGNLRFEKGVKNIETDLENQQVVVTYDAEKTDESKLEAAFGKINYKVTKVEKKAGNKACDGKSSCSGEKKECDHKDANCCKGKEKKDTQDCCSKDKKK